MDSPPPAKASLEAGEDTDMRGEENEASAIDNDDGRDTSLLYQNQKKRPKRIEVPSPQKIELSIMEVDEEKHEEGYDSDGFIGPYWGAVRKEGRQLYDNDDDDDGTAVREELVDAPPPPPPPLPPPLPGTEDEGYDLDGCIGPHTSETVPVHVPIPDDVLNSKAMNKKQLKKELKNRLQLTSGVKNVLKERLKAVLDKKVPYYTDDQLKEYMVKKKGSTCTTIGGDTGLSSFPPTAHWKELKGTIAIDDPNNESFRNARPPTVPEEDTHVPFNQKYNFDFDITVPNFNAKVSINKLKRNGRTILNDNNEPETIEVVREKGYVHPVFKKKHNLSKLSRSYEFADAFLPRKSKYSDHPGRPGSFSFANLTSWTNTKAVLANAGENGTTYPDFVPFDVDELRSHVGLYVLQGLSPSPRIEYKFKRQCDDPVNGNDYVWQAMGKKCNRERRHKHFKAFFSCQDPHRPCHDRDGFPNWKVRPLLQWINFVGPIAWSLGRNISVDEMTMRCKGTHRDILRITYKAEGDGFQSDALCQDGYCYQHYMRNEPAPTKYTSKGFSPLHSRVLSLFDSLKDDHHHCGMDNLYNSAKFCRAAYQHDRRVLCHGVTRKGGRGIPECVKQLEVTKRSEQLRVRGTVKAAILMGDDGMPCLIASSVYDTKPVHYLSMVSGRIEWIEVKKKVYNVESEKYEEVKFLRMNFINNYNFTMGHVDVSDQLRGSYRIDRWVRNKKWWWSMFFWGIGVLLTNAYVVYRKVLLEEGVDKKNLLSQYQFRKEIALYWINPSLFQRDYHRLSTPTSRSGTATTAIGTASSTATRTSPRTHKKRKLIYSPTNSTISSLTGISSPTTTATTVNDRSLHVNGKLNCRLIRTYDHSPVQCKQNVQCQLHKWCSSSKQKMRVETQLCYCPTCNVNLCLECYRPFHTETDIVEKKSVIEKKLRKTYRTNNTK